MNNIIMILLALMGLIDMSLLLFFATAIYVHIKEVV